MTLGRLAQRRARAAATAAPTAVRTVPYDHQFVFTFTDPPPKKAQRKTIQVSVEAPFIAVSVGYGLVADVEPVSFGLPQKREAPVPPAGEPPTPVPSATTPGAIAPGVEELTPIAVAGAGIATTLFSSALVPRFGDVLLKPRTRFTVEDIRLADVVTGYAGAVVARERRRPTSVDLLHTAFRVRPALAEWIGVAQPNEELEVDEQTAAELFESVYTPIEAVQFKYALFDEGSGREFQSDPILSTAGLGASTGERPFRYFARPIRFEPLATITMSVEQVTPFDGKLYVVLHGYKTLGGARQERRTARKRRLTRRR